MTTSPARIRQGLRKGRTPQEELRSIRKLEARTYLDSVTVVKRARKAGLTWRQIGDELGMTESGARRKFTGNGAA